MAKETKHMTVEEKLEALGPNPIKHIDHTDTSHDGTEGETGKALSKELNTGVRAETLDPIPADAETGEYREPTHYDNGVETPKEAKVEGRSQLKGQEPKNFRALNEDELSEGEKPKSSLTVKDADTKEEKVAVKEAAKADTSFTKRSVSK